jgi:pyridoxine 4-dehydrogenase
VATIVSVQNEYNLGNRESEPVLERCEQLGIAFLPWFPLGAGAVLKSTRMKNLSRKTGKSPAQLALAWLLARSPAMLPIPGTGSLEHLEENMAAAGLRLSPEDFSQLDRGAS